MTEVLHANIFFFITGIGVIILTVLVSIALYHFIKILTSVRRIVARVEAGTETLVEDIENLRTYVMEESFVARFFRAILRNKGREEKAHEDNEDDAPRETKKGRKAKTELRIKGDD